MTASPEWDRRLAAALVHGGVVAEEAARSALAAASAGGVPLLAVLGDGDAATAAESLGVLARLAQLEVVDFYERPPDPELVRSVTEEVARAVRGVPAWQDARTGEVLVAFDSPPLPDDLSTLAGALGRQVRAVLTGSPVLTRVLELAYGIARTAEPAAPGGVGQDGTGGDAPAEPGAKGAPALHLDDLLDEMLAAGASDLHLTVGRPPSVRVHGALRALDGHADLQAAPLRSMLFDALHPSVRERFEEHKELDTAYAIPGLGRFRMNVFQQRGSVGAVLRAIPDRVPVLGDLGLPETVTELADRPRGLVLVTGPTGSGKSTTLAAMVDHINRHKPVHIMTIEDPIEHVHHHRQAVINQREVGSDTESFAEALRHVLRQDPDVILLGEMRDLETISAALTAAETGHLVFATLHTQDAPQSVDRMIDVFPAGQQAQIRMMLSTTLQGIVCQQLLPTPDNDGRVVAVEVLVATPAIRSMIREAKTQQIPSALQAGGAHGMLTMDQSLAHLAKTGKITEAAAYSRCANPDDLRRLVAGGRS